MKRLISTVMASAMLILTLSGVAAMAADHYTDSTDKDSPKVMYSYTNLGTTELSSAYDFDIEWGNLDFEYEIKYKEVWNDVTHMVETKVDDANSGWKGGTTRTITVTNNGEKGIKLSPYFSTYGADASAPSGMFTVTISDTWVDPGTTETITLTAKNPEGTNYVSNVFAGRVSVSVG